MRGFARGVMGWSEEEFWNTTMHGYLDAVEALSRFHGGMKDQDKEEEFGQFRDEVIQNVGRRID